MAVFLLYGHSSYIQVCASEFKVKTNEGFLDKYRNLLSFSDLSDKLIHKIIFQIVKYYVAAVKNMLLSNYKDLRVSSFPLYSTICLFRYIILLFFKCFPKYEFYFILSQKILIFSSVLYYAYPNYDSPPPW